MMITGISKWLLNLNLGIKLEMEEDLNFYHS